MSMSLFAKAQLIVKSNLHDLLDRKVNTPEGYRQLIRDLETAMAGLRSGVDEAVGTGNGYRRQLASFQEEIAKKQEDIDLLLGDADPSNDVSAIQLQMDVERLNEQTTTYQGLVNQQDQQADQIRQALQQLETKHQEMLVKSQQLTLAQKDTTAKNKTADALEAAGEIAGNIGSVDNIKEHVEHDRDVADARFQRVVGDMQARQTPEDAARLARATAALSARRAVLADQAGQQASVPTGA